MKKIYYICLLVAFVFFMASCENDIDNYDMPNGGIFGTVIDEQTGEAIPFPVEGGSGVMVSLTEIETGATAPITFRANQDGTYRNTKVFNGYYRISFGNCPVVGIAEEYVEIKGQTEFDILALPFSRISANASISADNEITVNYEVETLDPSFVLKNVQVMWNYAPGVDINNANHANIATKGSAASGSHLFELLNDREFVENHYKIVSNKNKIYVRVSATTEVASMSNTNYSKVIELTIN